MDVREKHRLVASCMHPYRAQMEEQTHNPGMCPDWESNPQPFGYEMTLPTEPHWPGREALFLESRLHFTPGTGP